MKTPFQNSLRFHATLALATLASIALVSTAAAKQGATDPIPGTSKGGVSTGGGGGGGGGGKSSTPTPTPVTPTPVVNPVPFVAKTITFSTVNQVGGQTPVCTGDYHIDPYYPTLSLMTVNVETTAVNLPDGSQLSVNVSGTGGTLYPFTSNIITLNGGLGLCTYSVYVTPGTTITSITISDSAGNVVASGN